MNITLEFTVGSNRDENFVAEGIVKVPHWQALLICEPYDEVSEKVYNDFCNSIVPNVIENCPYDWFFIKSPKRY